MSDDLAALAQAATPVRDVTWLHAGRFWNSHEPEPLNLHLTSPGQLEAKCAVCGEAVVAFTTITDPDAVLALIRERDEWKAAAIWEKDRADRMSPVMATIKLVEAEAERDRAIRERDEARAEVRRLTEERTAEIRAINQRHIDDTVEKHTAYLASRQHLEDDIGSLRWQLQALRDRITALADELGRVASATLAGGGGIASLPAREAEMHLRKLVPTPPAEVKHGWDAVDVGAIKAAGRAVVESVRPAPPKDIGTPDVRDGELASNSPNAEDEG